MSSLIKRLDVLETTAPNTLMGFYEPHLKSFSVKPSESRKRVCITNTCYALLTLSLSTSAIYDSVLSHGDSAPIMEDGSKTPTKIPIRQVIKTLLSSEWREDDLVQVPLLIYAILLVDTDRSQSDPLRSFERQRDCIENPKTLICRLLPTATRH
jgi:hypothetical protein